MFYAGPCRGRQASMGLCYKTFNGPSLQLGFGISAMFTERWISYSQTKPTMTSFKGKKDSFHGEAYPKSKQRGVTIPLNLLRENQLWFRKSVVIFCHLVSILPTFYEQLLHQNPLAKKLQTQIVSIEKLRKKLSYEKAACKLLVKLTPGGSIVPRFVLQLFFIEKSQK